MTAKTHQTPSGIIHYWVNIIDAEAVTLVFLPGLTLDHTLFEKQVEYFKDKYNLLVWDAPTHASSWPFKFDYTLFDNAKWLNEILEKEKITRPVVVGQSIGGATGQLYAKTYPDKVKGYVGIDGAPLQRAVLTRRELRLMKRLEPIVKLVPWKTLLKFFPKGSAESTYSRDLVYKMMLPYEGDKKRFAKLLGHGAKILAEAIEKDLPYDLPCPALLVCGEKDQLKICLEYNKILHKQTDIPLEWVKDAGHNANTDAPEIVNKLIEEFVEKRLSK